MAQQQSTQFSGLATLVRRRKIRRNSFYKTVPGKESGEKSFAVVIEGNAPGDYATVQKLAAAIQMSVREIGVSVTVSPVVRSDRADKDGDLVRTYSKDGFSRNHVFPAPTTEPAAQQDRFDAKSLYDTASGRLNAKHVSAMFAVPLTTIARVAGASLSAVSRTPDSPAIQATLRLFYRIAAALAILIISVQGLRIWMNMPSQLLDGKTPWQAIDDGEGEVVALVLESMVLGEPA